MMVSGLKADPMISPLSKRIRERFARPLVASKNIPASRRLLYNRSTIFPINGMIQVTRAVFTTKPKPISMNTPFSGLIFTLSVVADFIYTPNYKI